MEDNQVYCRGKESKTEFKSELFIAPRRLVKRSCHCHHKSSSSQKAARLLTIWFLKTTYNSFNMFIRLLPLQRVEGKSDIKIRIYLQF